MSCCPTCGTHVFEPGEPVDADAKLDRLRAAVVKAAMARYKLRAMMGQIDVENNAEDAACAALAAAERGAT